MKKVLVLLCLLCSYIVFSRDIKGFMNQANEYCIGIGKTDSMRSPGDGIYTTFKAALCRLDGNVYRNVNVRLFGDDVIDSNPMIKEKLVFTVYGETEYVPAPYNILWIFRGHTNATLLPINYASHVSFVKSDLKAVYGNTFE